MLEESRKTGGGGRGVALGGVLVRTALELELQDLILCHRVCFPVELRSGSLVALFGQGRRFLESGLRWCLGGGQSAGAPPCPAFCGGVSEDSARGAYV